MNLLTNIESDMKEIKMHDVFDLPLVSDDSWVFENNDDDYIDCNLIENAEAVVTAVNNHDKLVELLDASMEFIELNLDEESRPVHLMLAIKRLLDS